MKYYDVVVFGSRGFDDYSLMVKTLIKYFKENDIMPEQVTIIEGGAKGADNLAERFASRAGLKHKQFKPDWEQYGRSAGHVRNAEMAKEAQIGFAFWDGKSKGTESMKNKMLRLGREVHVTYYEEENK